METIKNAAKTATSAGSQFASGHQIPIGHQDPPGHQHKMDPQPVNDQIPTEDGGYQIYKAANKLQGKKALITGGDSGIGRAIAILFAMEGAESMIVYLAEEEKDAQDTQKMVQERGGKLHLLPMDLRTAANCKQVAQTALERMGTVNILVNNAAYQMMQQSIQDISEDQWEKTFATNIHPFFWLSKYILPHMSKGDTIINMASVNAYIGRPDLLDYTTTKGAIVSFTRALSNQVVGQGMRVNAVCPGPVWTPLIPATMDQKAQDEFHQCPMGRPGQPSEVATCVVFLASQDSSFISGSALHPNGGVITGS